MVKHELRDVERVYVNGILQYGLESGNNKPFWKYVKSQKQETFGTQFPKIKPLHISEMRMLFLCY